MSQLSHKRALKMLLEGDCFTPSQVEYVRKCIKYNDRIRYSKLDYYRQMDNRIESHLEDAYRYTATTFGA